MGLFSHISVGVDIGHASVKVVGVSLGKKPTFVGCKEITVDPTFLKKDGFQNHVAIGEAVRQAMAQTAPHPIKATSVHALLSESVIFRKVIELPILPGEQMDGAVRMAATEYLPEGLDGVELDYQVLTRTTEPKATTTGLETASVMVVAVAKTVVHDFQEVFKMAGLRLRSVEPKPSALARGTVKPGEKGATIIIDVGSELSTISLYSQGIVSVASTVSIGGNSLRDPETGGLDEEKLASGSKRLAESITDEVEHVVKFYTNRSGSGEPITGAVLSGGGSMVNDVKAAVESATSIELTLAKPIISVPSFCDRRFYGALGAALYPLHETA